MRALPAPRGPISEQLLDALSRPVHALAPGGEVHSDDPVGDEDLQLALYLLYELHYRALPGVDDSWEWEPTLLARRRELERAFEGELTTSVPLPPPVAAEKVDVVLRELASREGPSLSNYVRLSADLDQIREFMVHRSAYQLKEADPHSWAIPRLTGVPKAAIVEIQSDEYGGGRPERIHADLFARAMTAVGLDSGYGAYLEVIPAVTLATVNLMSLFGLHRRLRAAIVGHLALFELTSSVPNRRYGDGLRRLGCSDEATLFFDEHVVADAVHENIAAVDLAGGLLRQEPALSGTVIWGAEALLHVDNRWVEHMLGSWRAGRTSLRSALTSGSETSSADAHWFPLALSAR